MKQRRLGWMSGVSGITLLLACLMTAEIGVAQSEKSTPETQEPGTFRLTVVEGYLSLEAKEASVAKIFEEVGRQMGIAVDIRIGSEEKITIEFDKLPLEDLINRLGKNTSYWYVKDSLAQGGISKLVLLPNGKGILAPSPSATEITVGKNKKSPQPEPFKFEFDPSETMKKESEPPRNDR